MTCLSLWHKKSVLRGFSSPTSIFVISSICFMHFSASLRRRLLLSVLSAFVSSQVTGSISKVRQKSEQKPSLIYQLLKYKYFSSKYFLVISFCSLNKTYCPSSARIP